MALYWDANKVPDHERKLKEDPRMPECLMWAGFAIGLGEITEEMLRPWIGLRTNVSEITNAEFDAIMRKRTNR